MRETRFFSATDRERAQVLDAIRTALAGHSEIVFSFLYGSFVSEQFFRDIDIAVFLGQSGTDLVIASFFESRLSMELEEAIDSRFRVDVKVLNEAPLPLCFQVVRGEIIFCNDEDFLAHFMTSVARRYLEIAPLRHRYLMEAMA